MESVLHVLPLGDFTELELSRQASGTGRGDVDLIAHHLGAALLPALEEPGPVARVFVDEVALALRTHLRGRQARLDPARRGVRLALARWQEQRARELLATSLDGRLSVADLARACGLSRAHFARAFKESTGLPPHAWLARRRILVARQLLRSSEGSIAGIARAAGFVSQGHFSHRFARTTGFTPSEWRRLHARVAPGGARDVAPSAPGLLAPPPKQNLSRRASPPARHLPGIYGDQLTESFRFETQALTTHLPHGTFAITRACHERPDALPTARLPEENAFIVNVHLRDIVSINLWSHERHVYRGGIASGTVKMMHLGEAPSASDRTATDTMHIYFPFPMIESVADDRELGRFGGFRHVFAEHVPDPFMEHIGRALVPVFEHGDSPTELFFDHLALAVQSHMLSAYGVLSRPTRPPARGGLAPWQAARAKELLVEHLDGRLTIEALARECNLSRSHFIRAFRTTIGMPPHRWLSLRRVEVAKSMLLDLTRPISAIAHAVGFANQSHFTRVFTACAGTSPAAWRRANAPSR